MMNSKPKPISQEVSPRDFRVISRNLGYPITKEFSQKVLDFKEADTPQRREILYENLCAFFLHDKNFKKLKVEIVSHYLRVLYLVYNEWIHTHGREFLNNLGEHEALNYAVWRDMRCTAKTRVYALKVAIDLFGDTKLPGE